LLDFFIFIYHRHQQQKQVWARVAIQVSSQINTLNFIEAKKSQKVTLAWALGDQHHARKNTIHCRAFLSVRVPAAGPECCWGG